MLRLIVGVLVIGWIGVLIGRRLPRVLAVVGALIGVCISIALYVQATHAYEYRVLILMFASIISALLAFGLLIGSLSSRRRGGESRSDTPEATERIVAEMQKMRKLDK